MTLHMMSREGGAIQGGWRKTSLGHRPDFDETALFALFVFALDDDERSVPYPRFQQGDNLGLVRLVSWGEPVPHVLCGGNFAFRPTFRGAKLTRFVGWRFVFCRALRSGHRLFCGQLWQQRPLRRQSRFADIRVFRWYPFCPRSKQENKSSGIGWACAFLRRRRNRVV